MFLNYTMFLYILFGWVKRKAMKGQEKIKREKDKESYNKKVACQKWMNESN